MGKYEKILSFQGTSTTAFSYTSPAQIMKSQVKMTSKTHIVGKQNTRKLQKDSRTCRLKLESKYNSTGWPENKEKCTNLFNYCITYVDKHNSTGNPDNNNNGLKEDDPFVVKVSLERQK